jgi:uridylate kinase
MKTIVVSLGGSLIVPGDINIKFIKDFKSLILDFIKKGNNFIIVCGGGKTCRNYNNAAKEIIDPSNEELDRLGIKATELNAELIRIIFEKNAYKSVVLDYNKVNLKFKILVSCGYLPGTSSDYDAVMWAKNYKADCIINLTNVDYIYDKDPNKFSDAKRLDRLDWKTMQNIVGTKWYAGLNVPFDPIATKIASKLKLKVVFLNGKNIENLRKFLKGEEFVGSVIS